MNHLLRRLAKEHRYCDTLLAYLQGNVGDPDAGYLPDWDDLARVLDLLRTVLSGKHHRDEARLCARFAASPNGAWFLLGALRARQQRVAGLACELEEVVYAASLGRSPPRGLLGRLAAQLACALRDQIAFEENALFPLADDATAAGLRHRDVTHAA